MEEGTPPNVVVPPGHAVHTIFAAPEPGTGHSPGGLLIASFGFAGDEEGESERVFDEVRGLLERRWSAMTVPAGPGSTSIGDLMQPELPEVATVEGCLLWTAGGDGLEAACRAPRGDRLVERFGHSGARTEWLVLNDECRLPVAVRRRIAQRGVEVRRAPRGQPVLVEIDRPDGRTITMPMFWSMPVHTEAEEPFTPRPHLFRAPRLRRLLLNVFAARDPHGPAQRALYEELVRRAHPLLMILADERRGGALLMDFPGHGVTLPVFADERSAMRTARETRHPFKGTVGMPARELWSWAHKRGFTVAMNVFDDEGGAHYVMVPAPVLWDLKAGRVPR